MCLWRHSGKRCRKHCDACGAAYEAMEKLHKECKALAPQANGFHHVLELYARQSVILGISSINDHIAATILSVEDGRWRKISLRFLSGATLDSPVCWMDISFNIDRQLVNIVDIHSEIEDMGYGSVLMTHLIAYLRLIGYCRMTGSICPTDFDHEAKLRHFYEKFGFEIINDIDRRRLILNL